jgi:threonine dehydrogenase-like Zn-dependent dehydrogenase
MRAVVLRGGRLEVRETPDPVPGPGELLLRTLSTAICASDVHFMDHPDSLADDDSGRFVHDPDRDIVMGHEFIGEVVAHGPGCTGRFPIGTRVTSIPVLLAGGELGGGGTRVIGQHPEAPGSFGERMLVSEALARAVPEGVSADAVALVDAFAVGEFYVRSSRIAAGEIPLVIGAGAIGLSAVAALASRGLEPVIVSDYKRDRLELARVFGAHVGVNPGERSPHEVWRQIARDRGVTAPPVIFECVGAAGLI